MREGVLSAVNLLRKDLTVTSCERYERIARQTRNLIAAGKVTAGVPVSEEAIAQVEAELGFALSPSLKWFLQDFGPVQLTTHRPNSENSFCRRQVLAPNGPEGANLMDAARSLWKGKGDLLPLPANLYPFEFLEVFRDEKRTEMYYLLDAGNTDTEGEHRLMVLHGDLTAPEANRSFLDTWIRDDAAEEETAPPAYEESAARLRSDICRDHYIYGDPVPQEKIAAVEQALDIKFPEAYRRFLMEFGLADLGPDILPIEPGAKHNVLSVITEQRQASPRIPSDLIPFGVGTMWHGGLEYTPRYICFDRGRLCVGEPRITEWVPDSDSSERLNRTPMTFRGWLDRRARMPETGPPWPPRSWRNNPGWDRYWALTIADEKWREPMVFRGGFGFQQILDWLREQRFRRILFAGNGISLQPYALAHIGFDATALDVSSVASEFVKQFPITPANLTRFLPAYVPKWYPHRESYFRTYDEDESLKRVERECAPGGSVQVITADMFAYSPEVPFDIVYSRTSFQGFEPTGRAELARRFADWVRPGGVCIVETMNVSSEGCIEMVGEFQSAGFFVRGVESQASYEKSKRARLNPDRHKRREAAKKALEAKRLAHGEKLVIFCHGSG